MAPSHTTASSAAHTTVPPVSVSARIGGAGILTNMSGRVTQAGGTTVRPAEVQDCKSDVRGSGRACSHLCICEMGTDGSSQERLCDGHSKTQRSAHGEWLVISPQSHPLTYPTSKFHILTQPARTLIVLGTGNLEINELLWSLLSNQASDPKRGWGMKLYTHVAPPKASRLLLPKTSTHGTPRVLAVPHWLHSSY